MTTCFVFDPTLLDPISSSRGGGRFIQLLKENLPAGRHGLTDVTFIDSFGTVDSQGIILIPFFDPFGKPVLDKRIARKQILIIYDVIPLKYSSHFPVGIKGRLNIWKNKRALKYYDTIVTISETSKKDIIQYLGISQEKIVVIYPTLSNKLRMTQEIVREKKNPYCLYVGDVNWNKNIVNMAKAIKLAHIPCMCVGKAFENKENLSHPWQKEFKQFVDEIKDDPLFIFPGYVTDGQLKELYQHASLNLLLSRDEGFGFSYLEASNLSIPSLLSDIDIFHEIARDGGEFVDSEKPEEIAKKIQLIMRSGELQIKLGREAKTRAAFFSNEKFKQSWKEVLTI